MADRARMAKMPQPEQALKCPRCDSTNTKFCYFNNYSLSQPRHFCKTCRRYWTRGGALRNVPVGGGCRRNKRKSSSSGAAGTSSKSSSAAGAATAAAGQTSTATSAGTASLTAPPTLPQLPFHMMDYGALPNIGLGFPGMQSLDPTSVENSNMVSEQQSWRLNHQIQQFPFLGGMEAQLPPVPGVYPFDNVQAGGSGAVKMEESNQRVVGINLARQFNFGVNPRNDQFWGGGGDEGSSAGGGAGGAGGGGGWMTNLSGFNSSSSGSML